MDYNKIVSNLLTKMGWKETPATLLRMWEQFVEQCEEGYTGSIYDFDNVLSIRDKLQVLIDSDELKKFNEYNNLVENIEVIDAKLRTLFSNDFFRDGNQWWYKGILKYASYEYCSDIEGLYGIYVEER